MGLGLTSIVMAGHACVVLTCGYVLACYIRWMRRIWHVRKDVLMWPVLGSIAVLMTLLMAEAFYYAAGRAFKEGLFGDSLRHIDLWKYPEVIWIMRFGIAFSALIHLPPWWLASGHSRQSMWLNVGAFGCLLAAVAIAVTLFLW